MCLIFKNNEKKIEEDIYYKNIKEASIFLDKAILTLSSAFLGFIFSQLKDLLGLKLIHINYLIISIISIGITIILVLLSYILTIEQAKLGYDIQNGDIKKKKGDKKFKILDILQNTFRWLYFITFITPIIYTILFYISNITKYVGQ